MISKTISPEDLVLIAQGPPTVAGSFDKPSAMAAAFVGTSKEIKQIGFDDKGVGPAVVKTATITP